MFEELGIYPNLKRTSAMDSKKKHDPFDIHDRGKIRIKEFLVFKELDDDRDNYIIKEFEKTKAQTLEALEFIQRFI